MSADFDAIPAWHRDWIKQHASDRATRAYFEIACASTAFDRAAFETAGIAVIHDIGIALEGFETEEITRDAQIFGAEAFIRGFADLMRLHVCEGRA